MLENARVITDAKPIIILDALLLTVQLNSNPLSVPNVVSAGTVVVA